MGTVSFYTDHLSSSDVVGVGGCLIGVGVAHTIYGAVDGVIKIIISI